MAFQKVTAIKTLPGYLLLADFADGKQTCYNVGALMESVPAFRDLKNIAGLFELARVDVGGYGVSWNDDLDLAADELHNHGKGNYPHTRTK